MEKIIKKWGNSLVLVFDTEDVKAYSFVPGDVVEIEIKKEVAKHGKSC